MALDNFLRKVVQECTQLKQEAESKNLILVFEADRMADEGGIDVLMSIIGESVDFFEEFLICDQEDLDAAIETTRIQMQIE